MRGRTARSEFDLSTKFDDPVGRYPEELGSIESGLRHQYKEPLAPSRQQRTMARRDQFFAPDDERRLQQVEAEPLDAALRQRTQNVRLVHEAVPEAQRIDPVAKIA